MGVIVGFLEDLAAAKEKVADRVRTPNLSAVVNGTLHEVFFYRASSELWSTATAKNPPRENVALDIRNGYSIAGVTREIAAECGRLVEGEENVELTAEQWADFFEVIPPSTVRLIEANVWHLHDYDTEQEILRAKKASQRRPASRKKPN